MHPPCEVMVKSFLPGVRGLVALNLREKGLSQGKIAAMIGVTQVAVHQYMKKGPKFYQEKLVSVGLDERDIFNLADLLSEDLFVSQVDAIYTLYSMWRGYLSNGKICSIHQNMYPTLASCDVCMKLFGHQEYLQANKREILDELSHAVKLLEASSYFPKIMPQVSVNIVFADSSAKGESDIAAMPGRIVKVHNRAKALMAPEFGVSYHMAKVLLAYMMKGPDKRAAINIRYDDEVKAVLEQMGITYIKTVEKSSITSIEDDKVVVAIKATLRDLDIVPEIVIDEGGPGLEPMAYLFDVNATEVTKKALEIARNYH